MGDPNGIGPEVLLKALAIAPDDLAPVVFGSRSYLQALASDLSLDLEGIAIHDVGSWKYPPRWGEVEGRAGEVARASLEAAAAACRDEGIPLLVTAPVHKKSLNLAGFGYPGQTEFLTDFFEVEHSAMAFLSDRLHIALVTVHIPLSEVFSLLTVDRIVGVSTLFFLALRDLGLDNPRVAICGLNPHASEEGMFGSEEASIVEPAVRFLQERFGQDSFEGPFSADTVFYSALQGRFEGVVALYHDQGLIALKTLCFDQAVNVTLGLPIVRTSPDHGTAFDLAGQMKARSSSMQAAIAWGVKLATAKTKT